MKQDEGALSYLMRSSDVKDRDFILQAKQNGLTLLYADAVLKVHGFIVPDAAMQNLFEIGEV